MLRCKIYTQTGGEIASFCPADPQWSGSISVGRSSRCAVSLKHLEGVDNTVSRTHFSIVKRGGAWYITPASSSSAMYVDGEKVIRAIAVQHGLTVQFGNCSLNVEDEQQLSGYSLMWREESGEVKARRLSEGTSKIGTSTQCTMVVNHKGCSRFHAEITILGDDIRIKDLGSTNGTYVNGRTIAEQTPLKPKQLIRFGKVPAAIIRQQHAQEYLRSKDPFAALKKGARQRILVCCLFALLGLVCVIYWPRRKESPPEGPITSVPTAVRWSEVESDFWSAMSSPGKTDQAKNVIIKLREADKIEGMPGSVTLDDLNYLVDHESEAQRDLLRWERSLESTPVDGFLQWEETSFKQFQSDLQQRIDQWRSRRDKLDEHSETIQRYLSGLDGDKESYFCTHYTECRGKLDDGINCMKTVGDLLNWVDKGEWDRIDMDREQLPERLDESEALSEICEAIKGLASLRQDVLALEAQFETSFKAFNVQDTKDRIKDLRKELGEKTGNLHAALPAMSEEMWQPIHSEISESLDRKSEWADKLRSAKTLFEQWQPSPIEDATDTKLLQDLVTQWGNLKGDVDKAKVFKTPIRKLKKLLIALLRG